MMMTGMMTDDE